MKEVLSRQKAQIESKEAVSDLTYHDTFTYLTVPYSKYIKMWRQQMAFICKDFGNKTSMAPTFGSLGHITMELKDYGYKTITHFHIPIKYRNPLRDV